jgi:hypothetical protein
VNRKIANTDLPAVHVVIPTHTDLHLRRTLLGVSRQVHAPESVTICCDSDEDAIEQIVNTVHEETSMPMTLVLRTRHDEPRRAQTRNNGLRSLLHMNPREEDVVLFLDGDCIPDANLTEVHATRSIDRGLVIGYVIRLDEHATNTMGESDCELQASTDQINLLQRRMRRARRQLLLRRMRLTKSHKPKAVTGNMGVRLCHVLDVNGFDEHYMNWGFEDDDFTRRLYASGVQPSLAHTEAIIFHQWHPVLKQADWNESSTARRFRRTTPIRCTHGIDRPIEQNEIRTVRFER